MTVVQESTENHFARTWLWLLHGGGEWGVRAKDGRVAGGGGQASHATPPPLSLKRRPAGPQLRGLPAALNAGPAHWALAL